ncbi:diacylglycerol kinase [Paraferrimonas sp. SM1919]|uniref:diacylglycerol kinase n=1 Tax=Paraferrimonas sp. SM1919 TaxID=2662263 RepID=UPI0013D3EF95|nr:diacylglycerol kinase [Paraferrimonas sp. SM1919]
MSKPGRTGLTRIVYATKYSMQGLKAAFKHEAAFRQEVMMLVAALAVVAVFDFGLYQSVALIISVLIIMLAELMNSAVEAVVDRIGPEHHELSGRAKDIGSAAVFIAMVIAGMIWLTVFYQHFF